VNFDARDLARGWLAVALASAKDAQRPVLNRTVFIEYQTYCELCHRRTRGDEAVDRLILSDYSSFGEWWTEQLLEIVGGGARYQPEGAVGR
jgi:hypothetical protein